MGGKGSKQPSEAEQQRFLQLWHIKQGLSNAGNDIHFENLVLEGAGNKAVSYYGALKVLEEVGLLGPIKRYAGVGAGAGWAMFLSIGLNPSEIAELNLDNELSYHAKFGMFAFMPNLAQKLGWSPLGRAVKVAQRVLEQRTGKQDLTFKEVLDLFGRELCIVATNLTTGSLEYFHPKTTPDVSIVDALVMSATLPGIMKPKYLMRGGQKHYFVDGGVLSNYCIHAFDGWYLSMKKEDSFLSRLSGNLEPPFKGYNDKTLGIVTVSPGDGDFGEKAFLRRLQNENVVRPNTKLVRSKGAESESRLQRAVSQDQVQEAGQRLLSRLRNANISGEDQITVHDFQRALGEGPESNGVDDIELLFGKTRDELTQIFEQLNVEREGKVTFDEFVEVAQQQSMGLRQHLEGGGTARNIRNMPDIFRAVLSAVEGNSKRAFLKEIDIIRSIGVNTDYVGALDPLEQQDKNFLVMQGDAACIAFLLEHTQKYTPQLRTPVFSALPARQNSTTGSVIDPAEMREYTVPQNLYPTLPPSYESAMGDSDHLRDTLEHNWPSPAGEYDYHPEKRPLENPNMLPPAQPPQQAPTQFYVPQPLPVATGPDPWAMPQGLVHGHQARVRVSPQAHQQPLQQPIVQALPQTHHQQGLGHQAQIQIQQVPQPQPQVAQHPQALQVRHAPAAVGTSHFTVSIGVNPGLSMPAPTQPQGHIVHQPAPVQPATYTAHAQPQSRPQPQLQAASPVMQRRQPAVTIVHPQGAPLGVPRGLQQRHVVRPVQGMRQNKRHQRQLAVLQGQQGEINHVVYVT